MHVHIAFVASKAVTDQEAAESQVSNSQIAQQRIGDFGGLITDALDHLHHHHDHHHEHEDHDPGFWKKKVIWKEGWKKYWVRFKEKKRQNLH